MTFKLAMVSLCAAAIAAMALAAGPADAAAKKRVATKYRPVPVSMAPASRITVRARSFLDGGTESLGGEMISRASHQLFAVTGGYKPPLSIIENTAFYHRDPLPGPFDLPDRRNPYPFGYCTSC